MLQYDDIKLQIVTVSGRAKLHSETIFSLNNPRTIFHKVHIPQNIFHMNTKVHHIVNKIVLPLHIQSKQTQKDIQLLKTFDFTKDVRESVLSICYR